MNSFADSRLFAVLIPALVLLGCGAPAERNDSGEVVASGDIDVFHTKIGDCFDDQSYDDEVSDVPGVPCMEPHDNEVYALFDTALESYPGEDEMFEMATEQCIERFDAYVGMPYEDSILDVFPLIPTLSSWKQLKDREIICVLYHLDQEKLVGSMMGSEI
jgi:hypothetical protein